LKALRLAWGAAVFGLAALLWTVASAAPTFPVLTGRVVDGANMLSPAVEASLDAKLAALEAQTGRQLVIATLPSLQGYEIEDYGYQLGRSWGIGEAKANTGVLLIVAPGERKVRIEVGYGLEPILTDALTSTILQGQVLPRFKVGDMEGGVVAGADAIAAQLALPADEAAARAKAAAVKPQAKGDPRSGFPIFLIIIFLIFMFTRGGGRGGLGRGGSGALPWLLLGAMSSRGGRDGWGGGGGFGGGGGGFSGGGGSFGGGGSSGSW
jgi:uncharacterized protein